MEKNKIILKGNLGTMPEYYEKENGVTYTRLNIAINNYRKLDDGSYESLTPDWFNVTCFNTPNNLATRVALLEVGDLIRVHGRLSTSKYTKNDQEISAINIIATDIEKIEPLRDGATSKLLNNVNKVMESAEEVNENA